MDWDTKIRMAENELEAWIKGERSNTNQLSSFYDTDHHGEWLIATEKADAATIERLTNSLKALYLIRENRRA